MVVSIVAAVVTLLVLVLFYRIGAVNPSLIRERFRAERKRLEADFLAAAASSGKPRGLRWKALDWMVSETLPEPVLARDRSSGEIVALLPVIIQFEAVAGGDMEGLPAVGNLRSASAVFYYRRGRWHASNRAVFNLNPDEALTHFKDRYVPLEPREPPAAGTP